MEEWPNITYEDMESAFGLFVRLSTMLNGREYALVYPRGDREAITLEFRKRVMEYDAGTISVGALLRRFRTKLEREFHLANLRNPRWLKRRARMARKKRRGWA